MINIGVIGAGHWGPNLIRNFASLREVNLHTICDLKQERLAHMKQYYPQVKVTTDYLNLLEDSEIEAIVIATPAASHYQMAKESLLAGKHLLVEKPLALSSKEAEELVELAEKMDKILMVGHTFEYNAAVNKLKEYIDSGELGDIYYIYSERLNLGRIRDDINAMWNFAPHDVSIILYLLGKLPVRVSAQGFSYIQSKIEDIAFITLEFANGVGAHIHISWLNPNKVRRMTVVGSKKMVIYDDVSADAKVQVYDRGIDKKSLGDFENFGDFQLLLRSGDIYIPKINFIEPLKVECAHFIECIRKGKRPLTDGEDGLRVVRVIEVAQRSLESGGIPQEL
jgi:predicted dehydrogenase